MDKPAPEVEDFDEMLPHVGSFGLFQKRVLCVSLPINYFLAVVCMAQVYQTMVPDHWCHVPELQHLPVDLRRNVTKLLFVSNIYVQRISHSNFTSSTTCISSSLQMGERMGFEH